MTRRSFKGLYKGNSSKLYQKMKPFVTFMIQTKKSLTELVRKYYKKETRQKKEQKKWKEYSSNQTSLPKLISSCLMRTRN